jgi:hypothetical protein
MIRRRRGGRLNRRSGEHEEDINPMNSTGNMADAMLVLAVGIMLAMVANWNIDLSQPDQMRELDGADTLSEEEMQEVEANEALEELGTVYFDSETGKYYVKVEE